MNIPNHHQCIKYYPSECDCSELISEPLTCSANGGTLPIPNGMVIYTGLAIGAAVAAYQCDDGYVLSDTVTRMCQGDAFGRWSGSQPTCKKGEFNFAIGFIHTQVESFLREI